MLGLNNALIKTKLRAIVLIASIGILILGLLKIYSLVGELKVESTTLQKAESVKSISAIIHEMQKERGMTVGFLSSKGTAGTEKLKEQRANVDAKCKAYIDAHQEDVLAKNINKFESDVKEKRANIDALVPTAPEAASFYSLRISEMIDSLNALVLEMNDPESLRNAITYGYIEASKESLGQIRAILNGVFTEDQFSESAMLKVVSAKNTFDRNINRFSRIANPNYVSILKTKLYTPDYDKMQAIIKLAIDKEKEGHFGINPSDWFATTTTNIDAIRSAQDTIMTEIISEASANKTAVMTQIIIALIVTIGLMAILNTISFITVKSIENSIGQIIKGFRALIAGGDSNTKLVVHSADEISQISNLFNEYMEKVNSDIGTDAKAIAQLNEIANLASSGIFSIRISESGASTQVRQAVSSVNNMLNSIEDASGKITKGMIEFSSANYQYKLETTGYAGCIGSMAAGLTALGNSNSELFAMITISGEQLETHAQELTRESEALSSAANEQAANLEETAAALEEMTSNIHSASDRATAMARSAEDAKKATLTGAKMADETAKAMVEIAEATKSINEAVAIIENIAFQTNILSLNAAVEAATAGEAGKGFAVVAQEVRNLANRSAEAAKQIKSLTETAKTKSQDGLKISDDMNLSFKTIAEKIDQTAHMVEEVASMSREQMQGITQINDAVTQLDQVTQQNAGAANGVSQMSRVVLDLAGSLLDAAGRTKFDSNKRKMVCNMDMIFDTTKLKLDHIKFKETNYSKVKSNMTSFSVTDHHSCALGKWLDEHKSVLQSSDAWHKMEEAHRHVHSKVKEFCDKGVGTHPNAASLSTLAKEIESDTLSVFDCLDEFKLSMCAGSSESQHQIPQRIATIAHSSSTDVAGQWDKF